MGGAEGFRADPGQADGPSVSDLLEVLEVARSLGASPELQPLLEQIEAAALRVLDCDRVGVFVHDEKAGELVGRAVTGARGLRFPADQGIAGAVLRDGRPIRLPDAHLDPRFNPEVDRRTGYRTRSLLTVPIRGWDDRPIGVLNALNSRSGPFDARDEALASALAVQVGVAIQRQLLFDQAEERRRFERDLDVAKRIQQGLMPRRPPKIAGYDLAGWNLPADETGGDFFDLQALDDGTVGLTVADVAGHGIGPALLMSACRAFLRATVAQVRDPARLVERVDLLLAEVLPEDRFITFFFALLQPDEGRVRYTSAGHGPNLIYRASTGLIDELVPQGCPLGVAPELTRPESIEVPLAPGDILAIFTDGFTDWPNPGRVLFGQDRLAASLARHRELPSSALIAAIYQDLADHGAGTERPDDVTAVVLKRN